MHIIRNATTGFDQHAVNDMTVAVSIEMTPGGRGRHPLGDTLFMGGLAPSHDDARALGAFGERKNWKVVLPWFDPSDIGAGPVGYHAVVTDGISDTVVLTDGRLWKRDRRSAAVLHFPGIQAVVRLSSKGRLMVSGMRGGYAEEGYGIARQAVAARAATSPGKVPVVSAVGGMVAVLDMGALADSFALAA